MTNETTTLPADFVSREPLIEDDQYIEFYENNPNTIQFDPPLTINEFKALLERSLQQNENIDKMSKEE